MWEFSRVKIIDWPFAASIFMLGVLGAPVCQLGMFDSPEGIDCWIDSESDHGEPIRLKNRKRRIDFARIDSKNHIKIFKPFFFKLSNNFYTVFCNNFQKLYNFVRFFKKTVIKIITYLSNNYNQQITKSNNILIRFLKLYKNL